MKTKFNKFERVAGIFVLVAFVGFTGSLLSVAIRQGWFDPKVYYSTEFANAEGLHAGSHVQIMGLKAGAVDSVELTEKNTILVHFYVLERFQDKMRADCMAALIRPFVIGERAMDITPGTPNAKPLAVNDFVPSQESTDFMTMISGKSMGKYLQSFNDVLTQLNVIATAVFDKDRTKSFIDMMDRMDPMLKNLNTMSVEVIKLSKTLNKDDKLGTVLGNVALMTNELKDMLPEVKEKAPQMLGEVTTLITNLSELTSQFKSVTPALNNVDLPRVSKRAVEALDEAVVLMKALQKSFLVKSNVQEVRDEEAKAVPKPDATPRTPASTKDP